MKIDTVSTTYGPVQGVPCKREKDILVFKGIPIGADTSGSNRFREPQPPEPWQEVKVCDTWPDRFLQHTAEREPGTFWGDEFFYDPEHNPGNSENGLVVNVFVPENTGDTPLPVFAFIHGGGFSGGYGSEVEFYAERLAAQGALIVFLQYRLSALGWLALPELSSESPHGISGNWAVLDVIHGLRWIHDNIRNFGGDPSLVTVGGQSAGAMMVTHLLRSPLARPYFRNAIIQSGFNGFLTGIGGRGPMFRTLQDAEIETEEALTTIFGYLPTVQELRSIPTQDWLKPGPHPTQDASSNPLSLLQQVSRAAGNMAIDGYVFTQESVDLLRPGNLDGVNILLGGTADEATTLFGDNIHEMGISPENIAQRLEGAYGKGCAEWYPTSTVADAQYSLMRAQSDSCLQKYLLTAALTENNRDHETFVYYLRQVPPSRDSEFRGAYHACDLWYVFDSIREGAASREWSEEDYRMAEITSTYWMNFVKYRNPSGPAAETPGKTRHGYPLDCWLPCEASTNLQFMDLGDGSSHMTSATDHPERDAHHRQYLHKQMKAQ